VSEQDIDDVDAQFRCLRIAYQEEEGIKMKLDAHCASSKNVGAHWERIMMRSKSSVAVLLA
jgi:hypothetical protein